MKIKTVSMALALSLLLGASYTQAHSDKGSHIKNYQHNYHTYARGENNAHRHRKYNAHKHKAHRATHFTVHHHYHTRHRVHRHKSHWSDDYWKIAGGHILLNELLYHGHNHRYCRHHFDH